MIDERRSQCALSSIQRPRDTQHLAVTLLQLCCATLPVTESLPRRSESADGQLRIVYTGRIVRFQKRAMDLVSIADLLKEDNSRAELAVAGGGSDLSEFLRAAAPALLSGT